MNCVHKFGTDRHKRQADITFLFEYIFIIAGASESMLRSWKLNIFNINDKTINFVATIQIFLLNLN